MSDIVKFEWDQPVEVALKYPDPKIFESQWGGERAMYSLTDGRVMYLDALGAARIKSLEIQPGEPFFVVKRKKGRLTDFVAFREGQSRPRRITDGPHRARQRARIQDAGSRGERGGAEWPFGSGAAARAVDRHGREEQTRSETQSGPFC